MSPTILNMVVDTAIHHLVAVLAGGDAWPERFRRVVQNMAALFYRYDGIIDPPRMSRIQEALDFLTGLFYGVGLSTDVDKIVGMIRQSCNIYGMQYDVSYTWRMKGKGPSYSSKKQERVQCLEFRAELTDFSLEAH